MSSFTEELTVTKVRQKPQTFLDSVLFWKVKPRWIVARSFRYYVGAEGSNDYIDVDVGDTTDFASIPRIFWPILPPDGEYTQAAVLHDKLCRAKLRTKKERDLIFLEAMTVLEVPAWKRNVMYWAVDKFGP